MRVAARNWRDPVSSGLFEVAFRRALRAARVGEYAAHVLIRQRGADGAIVELTAAALNDPDLVNELNKKLPRQDLPIETIATPILALWSTSAHPPTRERIIQLTRRHLGDLARAALATTKLHELGLTGEQLEALQHRVAFDGPPDDLQANP